MGQPDLLAELGDELVQVERDLPLPVEIPEPVLFSSTLTSFRAQPSWR